ASSVNSTALDMARFMIAQLAGQSAIMSEKMTREMQREQITMHPRLVGWGLGWQQLDRGDEKRHGVQHGGDVAGFSSLVTLLPSRNFGIFVAGHREGSNLRFTVTNSVLGRFFPVTIVAQAPVSMHPANVAAQRVAKYAGHYRANIVCHSCANPRQMFSLDVVANSDGSISTNGARFVEVSPGFFRSLPDGRGYFGFREDSLGRVTHLTMGSWQVMERVPMVGTPYDTAAIRSTILDYVDGWYEGDAARMERAVHPDLAKRIWALDPQRRSRMDNQTAMTLVQGTRRGGGRGTPNERRRRDIEILEIFGNAASARARMSDWIDMFHLARTDGQWRIVNVLWELDAAERGDGPTRPRVPASAAAKTANPDLWRELQAVNDSMTAAFNKGDLLAVARFYTDDGIVDGPRGERVAGRAALDKYWTGIQNPKSWKLEVLGLGGHPDFPYQIGRSTLVTSSPNGDRTSVVEFLVLWRREQDGSLRIAVDYYR
ncbi:MAG TPA: nuclear transport factor 2 family protein, partial [Gemmatimonadaceae bacterium]|nr:nuclear transport factor 2 family protein [Gemmatimonadaceae bacterium]